MKPEKVKAVFRFYRETLEKRFGLQPQQLHPDKYSQDGIVGGIGPAVQHCLRMCDQAVPMPDGDRSSVEKAMRWLGYIQGVLHAFAVYSLDDLKGHSFAPEGWQDDAPAVG